MERKTNDNHNRETGPGPNAIGEVYGREIMGVSFPGEKKITIKRYDFRRPDKFSRDQLRTLQILHETFARLSTVSLSAQLRCSCELHLENVDQCSYGEYLSTLPGPTSMAIISMDPLPGSGVLQIDNGLVFPIIERVAGRAKPQKPEYNRDLTYIEHSIVEGITVRIVKNLQEAWACLYPIAPRIGQIETNPQFAQIVPPTEMVIFVSFTCIIEGIEGTVTLCIPYLTIEPILSKLSATYWYSNTVNKKSSGPNVLVSGLKTDSSLYYEAEKLSLTALHNLKKGSLIRITGLDKGEAILSCGGEAVLKLKPEKPKGTSRLFTIKNTPAGTSDPARELLPETKENAESGYAPKFLETVTGLLRAMEEKIKQGFDTLEKRVGGISARQDELADQLYFGVTGGGIHEAETEKTERPFLFLQSYEEDYVYNLICREHPQIIALILAFLDPYYSGRLLAKFNRTLQADIAERIAHMERTAPAVLEAIEMVLKRHMELTEASKEAGGIGSVVEILGVTERSVERNIIERLEKTDGALADRIKRMMFVFEDIPLLDPKAMKKVIENTNLSDIVLALKASSPEIQKHFFDNMDEGKKETVRKESEKTGPALIRNVEEAQQRIVAVVKRLESEGAIFVGRLGEIVE